MNVIHVIKQRMYRGPINMIVNSVAVFQDHLLNIAPLELAHK